MLNRLSARLQGPHPEKNSTFLFWTIAIYVLVLLAGILSHPMWRDEIHFWSIAGSSSSLQDLLHRKAWDGHPDLWYILVWFTRQLTARPIALQLLNPADLRIFFPL